MLLFQMRMASKVQSASSHAEEYSNLSCSACQTVSCCIPVVRCIISCFLSAGGIDNVSAFTENLIEEPDAMFSSQNRQAMIGLVAFLEQVKFEIHQFIEHKM